MWTSPDRAYAVLENTAYSLPRTVRRCQGSTADPAERALFDRHADPECARSIAARARAPHAEKHAVTDHGHARASRELTLTDEALEIAADVDQILVANMRP
jgi:hypothetical protein